MHSTVNNSQSYWSKITLGFFRNHIKVWKWKCEFKKIKITSWRRCIIKFNSLVPKIFFISVSIVSWGRWTKHTIRRNKMENALWDILQNGTEIGDINGKLGYETYTKCDTKVSMQNKLWKTWRYFRKIMWIVISCHTLSS
jgi:hypothetical protein